MENELKIISLNVRGLGNLKKRTGVFEWLKQTKSNIMFLQETHSICADELNWNREMKGHCVFSHGSKSSRGTMVIFKDIEYNIYEIKTDSMGELLLYLLT